MADDTSAHKLLSADAIVPITGRRLTLPPGPIFHLQRARQATHEIGAFRKWAGYKDLGSDATTDGLALFQHVLSFGPSEACGRTGIHCHLAHVHIVIPTSGRGVFSYDGVVTEAVPGGVICQHGGTVHDQFEYSYAAASEAENRKTPVSLEATPPGAPTRSFGFLELFVPRTVADVEVAPPAAVTPADQATAWDHPYHTPGARFFLQGPDDPDAAYRPVSGRPDLEARDGGPWGPSGGLVATWLLRPASGAPAQQPPVRLKVPGEAGGLEILFVASGSVSVRRRGHEAVTLDAGDCLTCTAGLAGDPFNVSAGARLVRFFISARAEMLRERTAEEIETLEALGPRIITRREVRPDRDPRPVNFLSA